MVRKPSPELPKMTVRANIVAPEPRFPVLGYFPVGDRTKPCDRSHSPNIPEWMPRRARGSLRLDVKPLPSPLKYCLSTDVFVLLSGAPCTTVGTGPTSQLVLLFNVEWTVL